MKTPILLVCALAAVMGTSVLAEDAAATANTPAKTEKAKHAKLTAEQREAMMTKRLEAIKAKDEALYKELVALREKDPAAFRAKMQELNKQEHKAKTNKKHAAADK